MVLLAKDKDTCTVRMDAEQLDVLKKALSRIIEEATNTERQTEAFKSLQHTHDEITILREIVQSGDLKTLAMLVAVERQYGEDVNYCLVPSFHW